MRRSHHLPARPAFRPSPTRLQHKGKGQAQHWAAILCRSTRVNGKPKQTHVAYLGGITKADTKSVERRVEFWDKAMGLLDGLAEKLSSKERRKIEAVLAARVPRPTKAELQRHQRAQRQRADDEPLLTKVAHDWLQDSELEGRRAGARLRMKLRARDHADGFRFKRRDCRDRCLLLSSIGGHGGRDKCKNSNRQYDLQSEGHVSWLNFGPTLRALFFCTLISRLK